MQDIEPGQFSAFLVTGDTYSARHDLRRCGGRYDRDAGGFVLPLASADQITRLAAAHKLAWDTVVVDYDPLVPETADQRRQRRQAARLRRADRLENQAATRARDAAAARAKHKPFTSDWSFITEPIKVGHHSESRHRRLWDRIDAARDAEMRNSIEADKLQARADHLRSVPLPVAGDAERKRQAEMVAMDVVVRVGSIVRSTIYGREGAVQKVNRHTYTVRFPDGWTVACPKNHVAFVRHEEAVAPVRAFKKGDQVLWHPHYAGYGKGWPATVLRVNPTGYTLKVDRLADPVKSDEKRMTAVPAEPTPSAE